GILSGYLVNKAFQQGLHPLEVIGLASGYIAGSTFIGFFWWMNQKQVNRGDFFVLDKIEQTLTLHRKGLVLQGSQIQGFVLVHAWHTERDEEGPSMEWLAEL